MELSNLQTSGARTRSSWNETVLCNFERILIDCIWTVECTAGMSWTHHRLLHLLQPTHGRYCPSPCVTLHPHRDMRKVLLGHSLEVPRRSLCACWAGRRSCTCSGRWRREHNLSVSLVRAIFVRDAAFGANDTPNQGDSTGFEISHAAILGLDGVPNSKRTTLRGLLQIGPFDAWKFTLQQRADRK